MVVVPAEQVPADALLDAARAHGEAGRLTEAEQCVRLLLRGNPNNAAALHLLGSIVRALGNQKVALPLLARAISLDPEVAEFHDTLGETHHALGNLDRALTSFERAIELNPSSAKLQRHLGLVYRDQGRWDLAAEAFKRGVELEPQGIKSYLHLSIVLEWLNRLDEAQEIARQALALAPDSANALVCYGNAYLSKGDYEVGLASFRRALEIDPELQAAHDNLIFTMHYDPTCDREAIYDETSRWNQRFAPPPADGIPPHTNVPDPDRRIHIGYLSADLIRHPVGYFIEGVLNAHDSEQFEVSLFPTETRFDQLSERLRTVADHWGGVRGIPDNLVAQIIRRAGIDILVDLSGHTAGHRLALFAHKPAPVQATWLGYFNSTGVPAIDYLIADRFLCPPGAEQLYTEQIVRLPASYLCYQPQEDVAIRPLPALERGYVTFGCFNKQAKVNSEVVALWARILLRVPTARLMLKERALETADVRERILGQFAEHGIAPERLSLVGHSSHADYFDAYNEVDIALDPFPFNGGATTIEGLWMGVPLVALAGDRYAGRMGVSHLSNLGLQELIAESQEDYVEIAVRLAQDLPKLARLKATLRERFSSSPLRDGARFTRTLEDAYRGMWQTWCKSRAAEGQLSASQRA